MVYPQQDEAYIDSVKKIVWNLRSSDDRAFDWQSKGPWLRYPAEWKRFFFHRKIFQHNYNCFVSCHIRTILRKHFLCIKKTFL